MNVTKCLNGHFFDADKYQVCPHCGASVAGSEAKSSSTETSEKKEHGIFGKKKDTSNEIEMRQVTDQTQGKTFGVFSDSKKEPVAFETAETKCPHCGADISATAKFCKACGSKIEAVKTEELKVDISSKKSVFHTEPQSNENIEQVTNESSANKCPNCGANIAPTAKFCKACGTKIVPTVPQLTGEEVFDPIKDAELEAPLFTPEELSSNSSEPAAATVISEEKDEETPAQSGSLQDQIRNAVSNSDGKTVGFFSTGDSSDGCDPVVGWLVCVKGNHLGESFNIVSGRNSVGRGISNKIILSKDNTVSREKHAWITYEPKHRVFYVQPGESSGLTYLNGETLMESKQMAAKDMLEFGNGTYMLIPLCGEEFSWEEYIKE